MHYDKDQRTFDCEPTLTDSQVLQFCREGHLLLKGVVSDEINQRTCDWLDGEIPANPSGTSPVSMRSPEIFPAKKLPATIPMAMKALAREIASGSIFRTSSP